MRILYLTDDRSDYRGGTYYVDWMEAIGEGHDIICWGPGLPAPSRQERRGTDLLIAGHSVIDVLVEGGYPFRPASWWRGAPALPFWGRAVRRFPGPKVYLSKNDYKYIPGKRVFAENEGIDLIVTHSQSALQPFRQGGVAAEWLPFGVRRGRFRDLGLDRDIDIGFRGNLHTQETGDLRARFVDAVRASCADLRLDLVPSEQMEGFLAGEAYVQWLSRCRLVLTTVSAAQTVGTRFWEILACGAVPLAPEDAYEGLLEPDVHYLAVRPDFADLRGRVDRFLGDEALRTRLRSQGQAIAREAGLDRLAGRFWAALRAHGLIDAGET